jgi:hypothetical protein
MTPTPGKSMYWLVASSITSSTVTAPATGKGSSTSAAWEGFGTSAAGEGSAINTARVDSDTGVITTPQPPDDGGGVESSSKTTTMSPSPGPASVGGSRAA